MAVNKLFPTNEGSIAGMGLEAMGTVRATAFLLLWLVRWPRKQVEVCQARATVAAWNVGKLTRKVKECLKCEDWSNSPILDPALIPSLYTPLLSLPLLSSPRSPPFFCCARQSRYRQRQLHVASEELVRQVRSHHEEMGE